MPNIMSTFLYLPSFSRTSGDFIRKFSLTRGVITIGISPTLLNINAEEVSSSVDLVLKQSSICWLDMLSTAQLYWAELSSIEEHTSGTVALASWHRRCLAMAKARGRWSVVTAEEERAVPDIMTARWKKPSEVWEKTCRCVEKAPALVPKMVTWRGLPPKAGAFCCTHFSARVWSNTPMFPGATSSSVDRKPNVPSLYCKATYTTSWSMIWRGLNSVAEPANHAPPWM